MNPEMVLALGMVSVSVSGFRFHCFRLGPAHFRCFPESALASGRLYHHLDQFESAAFLPDLESQPGSE